MKRQIGILASTVLAGLALAGCGPSYVGVRVGPPPAPRSVGYIGVAPGPGYVWTDGYWDLRGSSWHWVDGRWMMPPRPRARWVPGYWTPHHGSYRWHSGRWR
jgi:hypothetical protein